MQKLLFGFGQVGTLLRKENLVDYQEKHLLVLSANTTPYFNSFKQYLTVCLLQFACFKECIVCLFSLRYSETAVASGIFELFVSGWFFRPKLESFAGCVPKSTRKALKVSLRTFAYLCVPLRT
jgi:hypothetical protein